VVTYGFVHTADAWTALGDPTRRGILARVVREPSSVTELARDLPVSRPAVSQHLHVLLDARLVDVRRRGRERIYTARVDGLESLRHELEGFWTQALANLKRVAEESYRHTEE
jgi:DNA-binding transcriptional ArsR family regulator